LFAEEGSTSAESSALDLIGVADLADPPPKKLSMLTGAPAGRAAPPALIFLSAGAELVDAFMLFDAEDIPAGDASFAFLLLDNSSPSFERSITSEVDPRLVTEIGVCFGAAAEDPEILDGDAADAAEDSAVSLADFFRSLLLYKKSW